MPRLNRPSLKQRKFVRKYVETGNATEAALEVYDTTNRKTAQRIGAYNLEKPQVQELLELALKKNNITVEGITGNVANLANLEPYKPSPDTILKANVELLKLLKVYPEKTTKHLSYSVKQNVSSKSYSELLELYKKRKEELEELINS